MIRINGKINTITQGKQRCDYMRKTALFNRREDIGPAEKIGVEYIHCVSVKLRLNGLV